MRKRPEGDAGVSNLAVGLGSEKKVSDGASGGAAWCESRTVMGMVWLEGRGPEGENEVMWSERSRGIMLLCTIHTLFSQCFSMKINPVTCLQNNAFCHQVNSGNAV